MQARAQWRAQLELSGYGAAARSRPARLQVAYHPAHLGLVQRVKKISATASNPMTTGMELINRTSPCNKLGG